MAVWLQQLPQPCLGDQTYVEGRRQPGGTCGMAPQHGVAFLLCIHLLGRKVLF